MKKYNDKSATLSHNTLKCWLSRITEKQENRLLFIALYILLISIFTLKFTILLSIFNTPQKGIATDLRNRLVGTRIALLHNNPYTYIWSGGESEKYIDPLVHPLAKLSRLTITPAALLFQTPFTQMGFSKTVQTWYYLQWIFLIVPGLLLALSTSKTSKLLLILLVVFFSGSSIWYSHLWLGQFYIVYVFILTLVGFLMIKNKLTSAFALLGLLALVRPPYMIILLSFFVFSEYRKYVKPALVTILAIFGFTLMVFNNSIWLQYFYAMVEYGNSSTDIVTRHFDPHVTYPTVIENWTLLTSQTNYNLEIENSVRSILSNEFNLHIPAIIWYLFIVVVSIVFLVFIKLINKKDTLYILCLSTIISIICEYLIPARRYIYSDIQWFIPISLLIIRSQLPKVNTKCQ